MEYLFPSAVPRQTAINIFGYIPIALKFYGCGVDTVDIGAFYRFEGSRVIIKSEGANPEKSLISKLEITTEPQNTSIEEKFVAAIPKAHKKVIIPTSGAEFQKDVADSASSLCDKV
jgi:hypothetical protein